MDCGIAGAALAEGDIETDGHMSDPRPRDQHLADEIMIRETGHLDAERQKIEPLSAQALDGARHW